MNINITSAYKAAKKGRTYDPATFPQWAKSAFFQAQIAGTDLEPFFRPPAKTEADERALRKALVKRELRALKLRLPFFA